RWSTSGSNWIAVAANETLQQGTVLWLNAATNSVVVAVGAYIEPTARSIPTGGGFLSAAGVEAWNLTNGLPTSLLAWLRAPPAASDSWNIRFPSASGLAPASTLPSWLAPGQALFLQSDTDVMAQFPEPASRINYYLQDHLGS